MTRTRIRTALLVCGLATAGVIAGETPKVQLRPVSVHGLSQHTPAELLAKAASCGDPGRALRCRLAALNWLLAVELEPMASRLVLRIPLSSDATDASRIVAQGQEWLDGIDTALTEIESSDVVTSEWRWTQKEQLAALRAFHRAFAELWPAAGAAGDLRDAELGGAAQDLALAMEDERPQVAAGALLWRAYLYDAEARYERAVDLLPAAMLAPESPNAVALHLRMMRCEAEARHKGGYAGSLALLARLEDRVRKWFEDAGDGAAAARTVAWSRRRMLVEWRNQLAGQGETEQADWCTGAIERLDAKHFAESDDRGLLRLGRAMPLIVEEDEVATLLADDVPVPVSTNGEIIDTNAPADPDPEAGNATVP